MANRPKGFGMTAELQKKKDAKYDPTLEADCREWMRLVLFDGDKSSEGLEKEGEDAFHQTLKDGKILCDLLNAIKPGSVAKINDSSMAFKQMENINKFLTGCEQIGCKKQDLFQTVDLYEKQNMAQVINGILALGRKAQTIGYNGPVLGPAESVENKREFTEEQLRAGEGVIGLQAGSNKGASQAGQNFGKTRAIID